MILMDGKIIIVTWAPEANSRLGGALNMTKRNSTCDGEFHPQEKSISLHVMR